MLPRMRLEFLLGVVVWMPWTASPYSSSWRLILLFQSLVFLDEREKANGNGDRVDGLEINVVCKENVEFDDGLC